MSRAADMSSFSGFAEGFLQKLLFLFCYTFVVHAVLPATGPLRIDCGNTQPLVQSGLQWMPDTGYNGGIARSIFQKYQRSLPSPTLNAVDLTLRAWQQNTTGCYNIAVAPGRFLVRLSFSYGNYDQRKSPPSFQVWIMGVLVEVVNLQMLAASASYYTDYLAYFPQGECSICFVPLVGAAIVNSLQLLPSDSSSYDANKLGQQVTLSNFARINAGGSSFGPEPADLGYRTWSSDLSPATGHYIPVSATGSTYMEKTGMAPDFLPEELFLTAREGAPDWNFTGFNWPVHPVDQANSWLLCLYFAEINPAVKAGERIFTITVGQQAIPDYDILAPGARNFTAVVVPIVLELSQQSNGQPQAPSNSLIISLSRNYYSVYQPIISGIELYEIISQY